MGAIDNFLKRWGYAKLDRYGLVLTPEDRVISNRPAVLDDGLGGKIVGWTEDDLAAMELDKWRSPKGPPKKIVAPPSLHKLPPAPPPTPRAPTPAVATPVVVPVAAPIAVAPVAAAPAKRPLPGVAPVIAPTPIPAPVPAPAPVVAADEEPGEDEWEWEIAMARARAAADETEATRADLAGAAAKASWAIPRKTNPGFAAAATSKSAAKAPEPEPLPPWPGTEPYNETWADKSEVAPQVMSVLQKKLAVQRTTPPKGATQVASPRATVIPVPTLPTASDPRSVRPAVSSIQSRRVARGTDSPPRLEDTVQTMLQPAPVVHDDRTSPYITLPNEVKPSGYAHTKRVASKQR